MAGEQQRTSDPAPAPATDHPALAAHDASTVDLHAHTNASDGTLAPADLVELARRRGLSVLAITDHDTVGAIESALAAAGSDLTVVPGVELSTTVSGAEVHILGYFVDPTDEAFRRQLAVLVNSRLDRAERMVARLRDLGYGITLNRVLAIAGDGSVGRPHIARALIELGAATSIDDAFERLLGYGRPGWVPRARFTPEDAVALLLTNGALPVLAHPYTTRDIDGALERLLPIGLRGIEVYYGEYTAAQHAALRAIADEHDLIPTGGSDYHGPDGREGRELGSAPVPDEVWSRLRDARPR